MRNHSLGASCVLGLGEVRTPPQLRGASIDLPSASPRHHPLRDAHTNSQHKLELSALRREGFSHAAHPARFSLRRRLTGLAATSRMHTTR